MSSCCCVFVVSKEAEQAQLRPPVPMLKVDGFLPEGLSKSNFVMSLKPRGSQTSHSHIQPVQRISVRSGLSQYPFVNLVGKSLCAGMLVLRVRR